MRLFAVTHATDYMRICCDLLIWWHCASYAERIIYEEFIFTQLTTKGTSIFTDLFMELSVMDIRAMLGKVYRAGMKLAMEHQTTEIPNRNSVSNATKVLRNNPYPESSRESAVWDLITEDGPFCTTLKKLLEMKLWSRYETPIVGREGDDAVYATSKKLEIPGVGVLDASILSSITEIGERRVWDYGDYVKEFYCKTVNKPERPDQDAELKRVVTTVKQREDDRKRKIILKTSTAVDELNTFAKDILKSEIDEYRGDAFNISIPPTSNSNRKDLAKILANVRGQVFRHNKDMKEEIIYQMNQHFESLTETSEQRRQALLKHRLFSLSDGVETLHYGRYCKKIFHAMAVPTDMVIG